MTIHSDYSKKTYLKALKHGMDSHFQFLTERATGFFLGSFFLVTYHSGWEWNRKITNEKNTAMGIVSPEGNGCKVRFVNIKGYLAPHYFFWFWLLSCLCLYFYTPDPSYTLITAVIMLPVTAVILGIDAMFQSMTERSDEGERELINILRDPVKLFSYHYEN